MEKIFSFVPVYGYGDGVFICRYRRNCTDEIASLKAFLSVFYHFLCHEILILVTFYTVRPRNPYICGSTLQ